MNQKIRLSINTFQQLYYYFKTKLKDGFHFKIILHTLFNNKKIKSKRNLLSLVRITMKITDFTTSILLLQNKTLLILSLTF